MRVVMNPTLRTALTAGLATATALALAAPALAANPKPHSTVTEMTPTGFLMKVHVSGSGRAGKMKLTCPAPGSAKLGKSAKFKIKKHKGKFTAARKGAWTYHGKFDKPTHFKGHGALESALCGSGSPQKFREPAPRRLTWYACPSEGVANPYPSNTPFTFKGVLWGAAKGTRIRLEYVNDDGSLDVKHLRTNAIGYIEDTHSFPSTGGEWGSYAMARYPDRKLAPGHSCGFFIE